MFNISKKEFRRLDKILLFTFAFLIFYGLIVLSSALNSINGSIKSQVFSTVIGLVGMIIIFFIDLDFFKKVKWIIYFIIIGMLLATLIFGFGLDRWGAKSWIKIGPMSLQPSEFVKFGLIIFLSVYLDENKKDINKFSFFIKYMVLSGIPIFLILRQPDFGTSMVFVFIVISMLFVSGFSWKNIIIILTISIITLTITFPILWNRLDNFQKERILNFGNSERDLTGSGYQSQQGVIALGSGQLSGKGYKQGPFSQNKYIPEQHTDFIFPVLVEEFGFIGGATFILMFSLLLTRILKIAFNSTEIYHISMSVGVFSLIFIHIFENVGMTMRIMPITGIPLPFFSNGGTFQIVNIACVALVFSVNVQRKALDF